MSEGPTYTDKIAIQLFGGIPAGNFMGFPILIDPAPPNDRIRIVHPDGRTDEFPLLANP